jgi:hypothetical protein
VLIYTSSNFRSLIQATSFQIEGFSSPFFALFLCCSWSTNSSRRRLASPLHPPTTTRKQAQCRAGPAFPPPRLLAIHLLTATVGRRIAPPLHPRLASAHSSAQRTRPTWVRPHAQQAIRNTPALGAVAPPGPSPSPTARRSVHNILRSTLSLHPARTVAGLPQRTAASTEHYQAASILLLAAWKTTTAAPCSLNQSLPHALNSPTTSLARISPRCTIIHQFLLSSVLLPLANRPVQLLSGQHSHRALTTEVLPAGSQRYHYFSPTGTTVTLPVLLPLIKFCYQYSCTI